MPINEKYIEDFVENEFMHIMCKAVSNTKLFKSDNNRIFFLKKYADYSTGYFETYSYILLDNHVHWLVKCVSSDALLKHLITIPKDLQKSHQRKFIDKEINYGQAIEFQCKDFFISYAMAFNKLNKRSGALFLNPFRRIRIKNEEHLIQIVIYLHANALKHGIHKNFENYKWSSYQAILSEKPTLLKREEILNMYGGKVAFINIHRAMASLLYNHDLSME